MTGEVEEWDGKKTQQLSRCCGLSPSEIGDDAHHRE